MGEHKLPKIPKKPNGETIAVPGVPEEVLRGMNHREWLAQFSEVLKVSPRDGRDAIPMTPFRAGAISRLKMAAEFIGLLQADIRELQHTLAATNRDLTRALAANGLLTEQIREHQKVDEAFDNPHQGGHPPEDEQTAR